MYWCFEGLNSLGGVEKWVESVGESKGCEVWGKEVVMTLFCALELDVVLGGALCLGLCFGFGEVA